MGMTKQILKATGYATAPKLTFTMNNPRKAAFAKAGKWATKNVVHRISPQRRRSAALSGMAAKGLGAAAVAVPLGWWLGRRMMDRQEH